MYSIAGTVTNISPLTIILDGEETGKEFKKLDSYNANINDRVILIPHADSYIVLGKVV